MPFKSTKQIAKFAELVKAGKMTQDTFDQWMSETKDAHKLPERLEKPDSAKPVKSLLRRRHTRI